MAQGQQKFTEYSHWELSKHTGEEVKHWENILHDL